MECSKCKREAVVYQAYSGQHLCREHLALDIGAKARRAIRRHRMIRPGDRIGVILGGSDADCALLAFLQDLTGSRRDVRVFGIRCEGTPGDLSARARESGVTKLASAATLEDTAAALLTEVLRVEIPKIRPGEQGAPEELPVITPFCHIPAAEIALSAGARNAAGDRPPAPRDDDPLIADVKAMLADYTLRHPAAPHAVLNLAESLAEAGRNGRTPDAT